VLVLAGRDLPKGVYDADMPYWYNVKTGKVETEENRSASTDLLGPFDTLAEATNALELSERHRRAADASDAAWDRNDDDEK
jgi:hypothetical protein